MISPVFTKFGWSRDDVKWTVGMVLAIIVGLAALSESTVKTLGLPLALVPWLPWCRLISMLVGMVSAKMATSNLFGKGNVPADQGAVDMSKRFASILLPMLAAAFLISSCAPIASRLPHLPDGSLDVKTLVQWASDGVEVDCQFAATSSFCIFGRDAVADVQAAMNRNPANQRAAAKQSLVDSVAKWPVIKAWFGWLIEDL